MMDRLTEALIQARDAAVEEQARDDGMLYRSQLEGYGDMVRKLEKMQDGAKAVKTKVERFASMMDVEDPQPMQDLLVDMESAAAAVCYNTLQMYAAIKRVQVTVTNHSGGDLLDLLKEEGEEVDG